MVYNLQHGVDAEYVTWLGLYPNPIDTLTLIPFLNNMTRITGGNQVHILDGTILPGEKWKVTVTLELLPSRSVAV